MAPALVDTSALYAILMEDDENHERAAAYFEDAGDLITHNYVILEAAALLTRRSGSAAVRSLVERLIPDLRVTFIDRPVHDTAMAAYLASSRRRASLVDHVSFEVMRREGIETAFAFDRDFGQQGFRTVP